MSILSSDPQAAGQPLYSSSAVQQHTLGEKMVTPDGRAFRYCKAGGTSLVPGRLQQSAAEDTTNHQNLTVTAPTAGDTSVTTTSTVTLTADALAGGYLVISDATLGEGQIARIKGNTAATAAVVTFTLEDPIKITCTGTVKIDVLPNPYNGVIVAPTTATGGPVGVAHCVITNGEYGWIQTHGPAAVLAQGTVTVGDDVVPANTTTAGTVVAKADATIDAVVGFALTGIATTESGIVYLTID